MYEYHLRLIIKYLEGKIDIYNGKYEDTINIWENVWDELRWMGYNPETANGIRKYIQENL